MCSARADERPTATPSGRVETDLPCARCGYNLRTLAWDGKCPECATPVPASGPAVGLRFGSVRSERPACWGMGLLAVAFLFPTVGWLVYAAVQRFWFDVSRSVHVLALSVWTCSDWLGRMLCFAPVVLIAQPFAGRRDRFRRRLALTAFILAAVGLVAYLGCAAERFAGLAWNVANGLYGLGTCTAVAGYLLACIHLLLRIELRRRPGLWLALCAACAGQMVILGPQAFTLACWLFGALFGPWPAGPSAMVAWAFPNPDPWWYAKNVVGAARLALLAALLLYLVALRRAPRRPT